MRIRFEQEKLADGTTHFTYTHGVVYDNEGNRLVLPPYDSDTLEGLACLTGSQVMDYYEGNYLPSHGNKVVKQTITLSMRQIRGLICLNFSPYYVKNSGTVDAEICYI